MVVSRITDIIIKSRENGMEDFKRSDMTKDQKPLQDCWQCRLIGGAGLFALGLLSVYSYHAKPNSNRSKYLMPKVKMFGPKMLFFISYSFGLTCVGLGTMRLAGYSVPDFQKFLDEELHKYVIRKDD
jgi:hypothetical protein